MTKFSWLALPVAVIATCLICSSHPKAYATPQQEPGYAQQQGGWDQPPADYRDAQRQGFHDGIKAAHWDADHNRRADADDHDEYRHPHVDRAMRDDYRDGFRHGYEVAMRHMRDHGDHMDHPDNR